MIALFGHESIEKYDWLEMTENEWINIWMKYWNNDINYKSKS